MLALSFFPLPVSQSLHSPSRFSACPSTS
jgi:hypothetical protein